MQRRCWRAARTAPGICKLIAALAGVCSTDREYARGVERGAFERRLCALCVPLTSGQSAVAYKGARPGTELPREPLAPNR